MRNGIEYEDVLSGIREELVTMDKKIGEARPRLLKGIGKVLKTHTTTILNKYRNFESNLTNFDGTKPYVHMADDVKVTVTEDEVSVHGGKKTGFKWHIVDDGVIRRGRRIPGKHFTDEAIKASEGEIERLIEEIAREVSNGG